MIYGSVCSGIEAATVGWHPLGWRPAWFSEIEAFPSAVLKHHYPKVENRGDMTKFKEWPDERIDVLVGGTPCQSFSVAGLRKGMADPRGNLALVFLAIADRLRPEWLVWENVPGVLSSAEGRDFGCFLGGLGELGYGFAYRVLDAQYFGVPQRRRRVFVVGHLGDWRRAAAVLFERTCLQGNPPPSRQAWKKVAPSLDGRAGTNGQHTFSTSGGLIEQIEQSPTLRGQGNSSHRADSTAYVAAPPLAHPLMAKSGRRANATDETLIPLGGVFDDAPPLSRCLNAGGMGWQDFETETLIPTGGGFDVAGTIAASGAGTSRPAGQGNELDFLVAHSLKADGFDASEDGTGRGTPLVPIGFSHQKSAMSTTLDKSTTPAVAFQQNSRSEVHSLGDKTGAVTGQPGAQCQNYLKQGMAVRRLTPKECERLQGFPDDYSLVPYRRKPAADGPRYKALGNSMAVPVMRWIGQRIEQATSGDR